MEGVLVDQFSAHFYLFFAVKFFEIFTYTVGIIVVAIIVSSIYFVGNGINETDTIVRKEFYKCAKIISKRNSFR